MSEYVDGFRGEAIPPAEEEEELLVVTADGKGVPMRRTLAVRLRAESEAREEESVEAARRQERQGAYRLPRNPCVLRRRLEVRRYNGKRMRSVPGKSRWRMWEPFTPKRVSLVSPRT